MLARSQRRADDDLPGVWTGDAPCRVTFIDGHLDNNTLDNCTRWLPTPYPIKQPKPHNQRPTPKHASKPNIRHVINNKNIHVPPASAHARARTHARTNARTHAHVHARTHAQPARLAVQAAVHGMAAAYSPAAPVADRRGAPAVLCKHSTLVSPNKQKRTNVETTTTRCTHMSLLQTQ